MATKESGGIFSRLKQKLGSQTAPAPIVTIDRVEAATLRAKYSRFRILVIGRANAGKTTMLKRVCNTTEEPSIYDEGKNLLEPTSERGIHDVRRSFTFKSNPGFIFHDSPGFEAGGDEEFKAVMSFVEESSKVNEVENQIHVIRFCFEPDVSRPLLPLEQKFFNEDRVWNVPVVAIFMKFDVLITKVSSSTSNKRKDTKNALDVLDKKFKQPLSGYKFQPRAYVCFESIDEDNGDHQEQVQKLIKETAASIDNLALKMLFVTVQQNNLEVCIEYAVNKYIFNSANMVDLLKKTTSWFGHCYFKYHDYGTKEKRTEYGTPINYVYLIKFAEAIYNIVSAKFKKPSLYAFAAILICLEHSFWLAQQGSSSTKDFTKAWDIYFQAQHLPVDQKLKKHFKLTESNDWFTLKHHPSEDDCAKLQKFIIDNLLSRPKFST